MGMGHGISDVRKRPGRKPKRKKALISPKQEKYIDLISDGKITRKEALEKAGYSPSAQPESYKLVKEEIVRRQEVLRNKFLDDADEMRDNMIDLARNSKSENVKFQATKDILDRAGLNPINKQQTEQQKFISIENRITREALERYTQEVEVKPEEK
jgi:hypothetical protein